MHEQLVTIHLNGRGVGDLRMAAKLPDEASLADAGITDDGDGLTMALGLRDPPVPEDEVDARLTSDDRGQAGRQWPSGPRIGSLSRPGYLVDFNPAGKTLDGPGAKALQGKPSAGEGSRVMAHHRGARGCLGLKTCGEIDSLPYRAELGNAAAYEFRPDQHQTRMDADSGRQRYIRTVPYVGFQILQPLEKLQRCANCALGVIFMICRKAKENAAVLPKPTSAAACEIKRPADS